MLIHNISNNNNKGQSNLAIGGIAAKMGVPIPDLPLPGRPGPHRCNQEFVFLGGGHSAGFVKFFVGSN